MPRLPQPAGLAALAALAPLALSACSSGSSDTPVTIQSTTTVAPDDASADTARDDESPAEPSDDTASSEENAGGSLADAYGAVLDNPIAHQGDYVAGFTPTGSYSYAIAKVTSDGIWKTTGGSLSPQHTKKYQLSGGKFTATTKKTIPYDGDHPDHAQITWFDSTDRSGPASLGITAS